jgi:tripartite ATP-independent transporter DctM subunit
VTIEFAPPGEEAPRPTSRWKWFTPLHRAENWFAALALGFMVLLPCTEVVLRKFFHTGVPGGTPLVQHLVLLVSMIGGTLAARSNRLLSISTLSHFLHGRARRWALISSHAFAATVCVFLTIASIAVVQEDRQLGQVVAWRIPIWIVQLCIPLGFSFIAIRLLLHAAPDRRGQLFSTLLAVALTSIIVITAVTMKPAPQASAEAGRALASTWGTGITVDQLRIPALILLLVATILGAPIFTTLGGAALILLWTGGEMLDTGWTGNGMMAAVPQNYYQLTVSPTLPSIPLFTLAGYFLAEGGAARRFVAVFQALFGTIRGGPAVVTVMVCAFFTSFTGASGVTILALGALLIPILLASGYSERTSLGLLTSAGSLGLLFPPCLPPILYSVVASGSGATSVRMEEMFLGGLLPGLLMMSFVAALGIWRAPRVAEKKSRFNRREAGRALWIAKWELLIPVVALGLLFGGLATPVEAAAVTAFYAFLVETFVYRDLKVFRDLPRVMAECTLLVGGVLLILGVALGFTFFLILAQVPDKAVEWVTSAIHSKYAFLLALNCFLLVVGCLMDIFSAIVVVVPLLIPVAAAFGIDPIHLGIIFLANLELGYLTPPVGMNLFLSAYRFNKPVIEIVRSVLAPLMVMAVAVLLITYFPPLTTWLPQFVAGGG